MRPAGGTSDSGTGTGDSETVAWVVVAAAVVVTLRAAVVALEDVLNGDAREPVLAAAGDVTASASRATARGVEKRICRE